MAEIGYTLSCEEFGPRALTAQAVRAERAGFDFAGISDHYHPWVDKQGNSPFVWGVLGALSQSTEQLRLLTGVTCPTTRIHPAIIAQAAATAASLLPGRFSLGVGSGENLNEHILGDRWPPVARRQERLEEAIEVIRKLWEGKLTTHRGRHYTVENARIYSLPDEPPPILVAVAGERSVGLAARIGDGLIGTAPVAESVEAFRENGGEGKPTYGQLHVCWAESEEEARRTALEWWPNGAMSGSHFLELPLPAHFEEAAELVSEEAIGESVVCGPDPDRHLEAIREYLDAGYDHVYVHQVGPEQDGFFDFYERSVLPALRG
ncbi:MAG TPA: TIGR03557 family F420-dependent LLM class oxidoreductase [Solirubrobacterales bacterium]|jgi:G6PDH family F420-dependent oxidoreductase|nr:TIGR03557 family F420-dependent LLM class oxidoreductase [Solirubrobacterales bacterium]